jgi:hypothetical protein
MTHTSDCICGDQWRFETTDLSTGQIKGVLHPISADWVEKNSSPGDGSLMLPTRAVSPADVWPHDTGLYISQVIDGERVGRWAGIIDQYDAGSDNTTNIGMQGIDEYLFHRVIADNESGITKTWTNVKQTQIAKELVDLAVTTEGIPLVPIAGDSTVFRDRTYNSWELKNIGEAIEELTQVINGVQYRLEHVYNKDQGKWSTRIIFVDVIGNDQGVELRGDIEGSSYKVQVDAKDHATYVYATGEGAEEAQLRASAYDEAGLYPRFHATPSWASVSVQETLNQHAAGHVVDYRDPIATPSMTIPGLHPTPEELQLGDRVLIQFSYGLAQYDGYGYILSIGWSLSDGSPVMRALNFQPEVRAGLSMRSQQSNTAPGPPVAPAPPAGAVSNLKDPRIIDSSGMAHSKGYN